MKEYVMALDQGTTSSRCIILNRDGKIVSVKQIEFNQIFPHPGWVEHDPEEIWRTQSDSMLGAMRQAGISPSQIASIGITNQRETTIVWNRHTGKAVCNAIVWQCRRTSDEIDRIKRSGAADIIRDRTGLLPDAYFSASKIEWILDNVPGARKSAEKGDLLFGTVDTWLMWNLSGGRIHATDYTNASRTLLYNIFDLKWDEKLLEIFHVPECMLPEVKPSGGVFGYTDEKIFGAAVPIGGVAGDQQAALFGQCCFEKGDVKNTYGTGCFLLMNTGKEPVASEHGLLTTIAASPDRKPDYALEGSVFVAGAAVQWLRDELKLISSAPESEDAAKTADDTGGVYIVPAFTGLGAPYWRQNARGIITGLTRGSGRNQIIRATLESLAYQTYDVLKAMEEDAGISLREIKADGGACANGFLMQFQADILRTTIVRPKIIETTATGAAYLAGLSTGFWKSRDEIKSRIEVDRTFHHTMPDGEVDRKLSGWHRALRCALYYADETDDTAPYR